MRPTVTVVNVVTHVPQWCIIWMHHNTRKRPNNTMVDYDLWPAYGNGLRQWHDHHKERPSQERCKACKRKGCWLIACPSHNGCEQKEQDRKETRLLRMQIDHLYYRPKSQWLRAKNQDRVPRTMDDVPRTVAGWCFRAKKDDKERRRRWSVANGRLDKRTKTTQSKEITTTERRKMIWKRRNKQPNNKCVKKEQDRAQLTDESSHPNCLGG